jgi:uncharacterized protein (DUF362 family)/NAD-dependent dihydropyrimidine dehydrogenase PreA subunit
VQAWIERIDNYDEARLAQIFADRQAFLCAGLVPGDTVLVKPNLLQEAAPERALTTNPRFIHAFVQFLLAQGLRVIVGDIPGNMVLSDHLAADFGLEEYAGDNRVVVCNLDQHGFRPVSLEHPRSRRPVTLPSLLWNCKVVFNLPKAKTHSLTLVTGAVKNFFGLTPKAERPGLHMIPSADEFARCLLDLHTALPIPERIVMDGILGMDGEGPSAGRPRHLRAVVIADDAMLADWAMCRLMGIDWNRAPLSHVVPPPDEHLVTGDLTPIQPAFAEPRSYLGGAVVSIAATLQRIVGASNRPIPVVQTSKCVKCGICAERCPAKAIKLAPYPVFNRRTCVLCYCCHEMCPEQAIELRHTFHR